MNAREFTERLLERAQQAGFEDAEVYLSESSDFEAEVFRGEITHYGASDALNLGFRGLYRGRMGCASTQVLDDASIELLISAAGNGAELIETDDIECIFPGSPEYPTLDLAHPETDRIDATVKLELARQLERRVLEADPRIRRVDGCGVMSERASGTLVNSRGLALTRRVSLIGGYVGAVAEADGETGSGFGQCYVGTLGALEPDAIADRAARMALSQLHAESLPSGVYPVVLAGEAASALLGAFAGAFSAEAAQKGFSCMKGREGTRVAADCLRLIDDPLIPDSPSSRAFDGEGVAARRTALISGGRLQTLLHNLKTARKQGVATTANAARRSCAGPIGVAPSNLFFAPSDAPQAALLKGAGRGVLITRLSGLHAGVNAVSGDFSLSAQGYAIAGGEIGAPVRQITLAGNLSELLLRTQAVGHDLYFGAPGGSRFGSPSLLVSELSIAGR